MKRSFFQRHALLVLMFVCFWVPFGLRGAREGTRVMRNDVKDWLPDRFEETAQLEEFRKHFLGEAFVMVSWEGCTGTLDDERFRMFVDQFFPELPPSQRVAEPPDSKPSGSVDAAPDTTLDDINEELGLYARQLRFEHSQREFVGNRFGFYYTGSFHKNWAGLNEKWFQGDGRRWYYILPQGDIYRWDESDTVVADLFRVLRRTITGRRQVRSTLVATLGNVDGPWYYKDPRRLEADLFKALMTGPALLTDLTRPGGALEGKVEAALERLSGVLFGPDGQQTCLLITLNDRGRQDLHRIVGRGVGRPQGRLLRMADQAGLKVPPKPSPLPPFVESFFRPQPPPTGAPELHMGGPPVDNVAIDEEGQITLARLVVLSMVVGITISWLNFRNWSVVLMLFFVGVISAVFSLSIVWWGGSSFDAVLMSMPSLVYVLGLSGAVHIANYYRDTVDQHGYPGSASEALAHGWKPCTVAALTTALGLVSLATSDIVPIRKFGFFSAMGVVFTLVILFSFLPAALSLWPPRNFETRKGTKLGLAEYVTGFWRRVGISTVRHHGWVTAVCLVMMVVALIGLPRINTSVQLLKLFGKSSKIIADYTWLETHLGKLVPMEVMVRVDPALMRAGELDKAETAAASAGGVDDKFRLNFLERLEIVEYIRREIDAQFGAGHGDITGTAMSATTFVPPLPVAGGGSRQVGIRGGFSRTLAGYRDDIVGSDYFRIDDDRAELWRLSLRLGALQDVDYGQFMDQLRKAVEPVMAAYRYRHEVLRKIDAERSGKGFRGGRVLLLGAPLGPSRFAPQLAAAAPSPKEVPAPGSLPEATSSDPPAVVDEEGTLIASIAQFDQTEIFSRTLKTLLQNSALRYRNWHDPAYALPEDFFSRLDEFECVVLVQDDPRYDLAMLKEHAPVVDARDAIYDPENGSLTALKRKLPIAATYTGLVPIVYKAQRTLLQSLIQSTVWAFAAISVVMLILLRSPSAGLVSMLPNVFPVVVIFGCMGWANVLVDIGTMMTASVAMGVAVDDTIHFLTWFRRGLDDGLNRHSAIMLAYDRCATAMTQTTLIGGLGLSVFGLSTFMPTQRFGILMLTLMVAALVGDLVFLPAILAGPAGRVFSASRRRRNRQDSQPSTAVPVSTTTSSAPTSGPHRSKVQRQEGPHRPPSRYGAQRR